MEREDLRARQAGLKQAYRQTPVGPVSIDVVATLDTDASDKDLERLAELTDRYCVVGQSLTPHPAIRVVRATLR